MASDAIEIFDFWRQCARSQRARLDEKRAKAISKALRWGYSVDDLKLAILGCCTDPWYLGQNERNRPYTDLGLILRDGDHIDKFIKLGEIEISRCWSKALEIEERAASETAAREVPSVVMQMAERFKKR